MSAEWVAIIGAILTALISAFTVIYQTRKKEPEQEASTTDSIAEAARKVVEMQALQLDKMQKRMDEMEKDIKKLRNYVRLFRAGVKKLTEQVHEFGVEPVWTPDDLPPIEDRE